ncbi:MAG: 16S rRNA (cytidine(1402)-2'-O)-methyltransferase [Burkholderiaceae bacterium]
MPSQVWPERIRLLELLSEEIALQQFPAGALYVVATPIGNMGDISLRALLVLDLVDAIACEDTRNTGQLLKRYGVSKPLIATYQHNEVEASEKIIARLRQGERIALVSDAGTPAVSDPGVRVVDAVLDVGLIAVPIAGPSAAVAALSVSGLSSEGFHFVGFLPAKDAKREAVLRALTPSTATLIFYEAPHRITETVGMMRDVLGDQRRIVIARELSKLFEQIHRCTLADAVAWLAADPNRQRGEFVLMIEGQTAGDTGTDMLPEARRVLNILLEQCSVSQAAALAAKITGVKKNTLYTLALEIAARAFGDD